MKGPAQAKWSSLHPTIATHRSIFPSRRAIAVMTPGELEFGRANIVTTAANSSAVSARAVKRGDHSSIRFDERSFAANDKDMAWRYSARSSVAFAGLLALSTAACGESSEPPGPPERFVGGPGVQPPKPGSAHAGDGPRVVFAVTKLFLGDTNRDGTPDAKNGWKQFGFDIDGAITTCDGQACDEIQNQCSPASGGSPAVSFPDGDDGIDNAFGEDIVPLIVGIDAMATQEFDDGIAAGDQTLLFAIDGLGASSAYNPLPARFYRGAPLGRPPSFDGTDAWPVATSSLSDPTDALSSNAPFSKSFVVDDTWVSGLGALTIHFPLAGQRLVLPIEHAVVTMRLTPDRSAATNGVISGILDPAALAAQVPHFAGLGSKKYCTGSVPDSIENEIRQASDILRDGSAGTRAETCTGISIGLGFEARRVELGEPRPEPPAPANPCAP